MTKRQVIEFNREKGDNVRRDGQTEDTQSSLWRMLDINVQT